MTNSNNIDRGVKMALKWAEIKEIKADPVWPYNYLSAYGVRFPDDLKEHGVQKLRNFMSYKIFDAVIYANVKRLYRELQLKYTEI